MKIELYCDRTAILREIPCNDGVDKALERLEEFRAQGIDAQVVDTSHMSDEEMQANYFRAIQPTARGKYSVRQIFGSRSRSRWLFGRGVPALVVEEPSGVVADVFPHNESGKIVTILDGLNGAGQFN
jgi:hypothetical protein